MSFYLLSESNDDDIDDNVKQKVCDWDPVLVCKMITIIVWNKTINFVKYWALFDDFFISLSQCRWFQLSWSMQYWVSASFAGGCLLTSHHQDNIFFRLDWPTIHCVCLFLMSCPHLKSTPVVCDHNPDVLGAQCDGHHHPAYQHAVVPEFY